MKSPSPFPAVSPQARQAREKGNLRAWKTLGDGILQLLPGLLYEQGLWWCLSTNSEIESRGGEREAELMFEPLCNNRQLCYWVLRHCDETPEQINLEGGVCTVDMSKTMSRMSMPQTHGSREWVGLPLV